MIALPKSLAARETDAFSAVLKAELEALPAHALPLQSAIVQGSYLTDEPFSAMILTVQNLEDQTLVKVGVFFSSIIAGCQCADDPTPVTPLSEYGELRVSMDNRTGLAEVRLSE